MIILTKIFNALWLLPICLLVAFASLPATAAETTLVPAIDGPWWRIAGNPELGRYATDHQQPVDFTVWQAADGSWQLWSCIRGTGYPGFSRLFYRWEGKHLTDIDWRPIGIAMTADPRLGEMEGMLQAPFVMKDAGAFIMFYGDGAAIAMADSDDGKNFQRRLRPDGQVGLFTDGFGTRDPMALRVNGVFNLYYSANPGTPLAAIGPHTPIEEVDRRLGPALYAASPNAVLLRTSDDLVHWSTATRVAAGGGAGNGSSSAECPFVYFHEGSGYYYLFRTQQYGEHAETRVYRSKDPADFGIDDDKDLVETLPVAAPELIDTGEQLYIAALLPSLNGMQIAKLGWVPRR